jgi:hypothetical protein
MKAGICIMGLMLLFSSRLSAQEWALDSCLAYALEHNKTLLGQTTCKAALFSETKKALKK